MKLRFSKMHGLGNDFVVIDAISQSINLTKTQIQFLANRHLGIGCDQILLVESPTHPKAQFKYRIFNADGSEVAQCGNGARCFARFVHQQGLSTNREICVETQKGLLTLYLQSQNLVTVDMGIPQHSPAEIPLAYETEQLIYEITHEGIIFEFAAVSMGNPHAVMTVHKLSNFPVKEIGTFLESHSFFPERVNVGFMQIIDRQNIQLRVFERGVGETLACGSGACAAVVSAILQDLTEPQVTVHLLGGQLTISWTGKDESVWMTGSATHVFDGEIICG
ncbi:MAG: hypothetical protein RL637_558 [Pseudomonadota bacterium]|jgi:diaminopimelate epimerase